jgi:hypothetical protein
MNARVTCENCKSKGKLFKRNQSREVLLIPTVTENLGEDSKRNGKGVLAPHGSATVLQKMNFVIWGTLFRVQNIYCASPQYKSVFR